MVRGALWFGKEESSWGAVGAEVVRAGAMVVGMPTCGLLEERGAYGAGNIHAV